MNVYIVTSGDYSDYHIVAVFMSRDEAKAYICDEIESSKYRDDFRIEEYEVGSDKHLGGREIYKVHKNEQNWWSVEESDEVWHYQNFINNQGEYFGWIVTNRGKYVALKIAQDEYYQLKYEEMEKAK